MEKQEYTLLHEVQDRHWWWVGRTKIIRAVIETCLAGARGIEIAEVGYGFGSCFSLLLEYGNVNAIEWYDDAIRKAQAQWGHRVTFIRGKIPFRLDRRFDLIVLLDVLEHIPDDREAVAWMAEHLNADGLALLTVPAHRFLWSEMDDVVHHRRRYSKNEFLALFRDRFDIVRFSFYNLFLFPAKVAFVLFSRLRCWLFPQSPRRSYNDLPPMLVNFLFTNMLGLEAAWIRLHHPPGSHGRKSVEEGHESPKGNNLDATAGRPWWRVHSLPFGVSMVLMVRKRESPRRVSVSSAQA